MGRKSNSKFPAVDSLYNSGKDQKDHSRKPIDRETLQLYSSNHLEIIRAFPR